MITGLLEAERLRHHYFYSEHTVPKAVSACGNLVLEVGAGQNPFGLKFAQDHPGTTVVSTDVLHPSKKGIRRWGREIGVVGIQDNFYYLVDVLEGLPLPRISAVFALFPSNKPETMEWLPALVDKAIGARADTYVAIVTENSTGKLHAGLPCYGLGNRLRDYFKARGLQAQTSELVFADVERMFARTEYSRFLQGLAESVFLLELNPKRRPEFVGT